MHKLIHSLTIRACASAPAFSAATRGHRTAPIHTYRSGMSRSIYFVGRATASCKHVQSTGSMLGNMGDMSNRGMATKSDSTREVPVDDGTHLNSNDPSSTILNSTEHHSTSLNSGEQQGNTLNFDHNVGSSVYLEDQSRNSLHSGEQPSNSFNSGNQYSHSNQEEYTNRSSTVNFGFGSSPPSQQEKFSGGGGHMNVGFVGLGGKKKNPGSVEGAGFPRLRSERKGSVRFSPGLESTANIKAFYVAKKVNIMAMFQQVYGQTEHWLDSDSVILRLDESTELAGVSEDVANTGSPSGGYVVVFDYGAVVFFECSESSQKAMLAQVKRYCVGFMDFPRSDDYNFDIVKDMPDWSAFTPNAVVLQALDVGNVRVISQVLGQTVALSHFEEHVDTMLETFESINGSTKQLHDFSFSRKQNLVIFEILRESNGVLADVIINLGILDRTKMRDTAWKYEKYFKVWEGLREEFEIDARWEILNTKTEYLQHNMRFFVELLNSRKGERLEIMIIVLITAELLVSLYALSLGMVH